MHESELASVMTRVFEVGAKFARQFTVPLVQFKPESPPLYRTGLLLQIADTKFVVTAAHHIQDYQEAGYSMGIVSSNRDRPFIPTGQTQWWICKLPQADIALAKLADRAIEAIGNEYQCLRITNLTTRTNIKSPNFFIYGYPEDMFDSGEHGDYCRDWCYITAPFTQLELVENYDPNLHLILNYSKNSRYKDGRHVYPPSMSGGGIWHVEDIRVPSPENIKLVAMQFAWHKGHEYAKGLWIEHVFVPIWKFYPELRNTLRFYGISFDDEVYLF